MNNEQKEDLKKVAVKIRCHIVRMLGKAGSGHPGGSLSAADILSYLYFQEMNIDSSQPNMPERDRFVLSKGHAAPVLYATLAEKGYFPQAELDNLRRLGSSLQGHPDMLRVPGVDISTGSLGTGFSASVGMALAARLDESTARIYTLLGDGELQEGQVWEAAMAAAHYQLDNLIGFVDLNGLQIDGPTQEVMNVASVADKFQAFGWQVQCIDGHDFVAIDQAVQQAKANQGKPQMIVCTTVKGKGVPFMENQCGWHGKAPSENEVQIALEALMGGLA